jgi:DNA polymerase-3 subunit delta'
MTDNMGFESIIGQPLAVQLVQRWLAQKTNQPLLFYGPEGVGKRLLALRAAQALNCTQSPLPSRERSQGEGWFGCGTCLSCTKIAGGKHPDVRVIDLAYQAALRGEPIEKQQSIRIETILEERKRLYQSAGEGAWKVSILDDGHRFTPDAANVLLKVMEEPPARTAIFLLTPFRDRIFSTLVSRCQPLRFKALSDNEMRQALSGAGVKSADLMRLIELAGGSPGRALHLNRQEQIRSALEAEELWEKLPVLSAGQVLAKHEPRARGGAAARPEIEAQVQALLAPALRDLRSRRPNAEARLRWIQRAQQQLRQNVPPALVYDHLLLKLSAVKAGA